MTRSEYNANAIAEPPKGRFECREPDWEDLQSRHTPELINKLHSYFDDEGPFELTAEDLCSELAGTRDLETRARNLLIEVFGAGETRYFCPVQECMLTEDEASGVQQCPYCHVTLADHGGAKGKETFVCVRPTGRHVKWILTLHGMNTAGPWQESFNWLASNSYGYSVPVAIYKYGVVRPGAFIKLRLERLKRNVTGQIRRLTGEQSNEGFGGNPDVIAHSLGSWLLGHALMDDPHLKVGRVILWGSILRPDFDWNKLFERRQVEAVLNNYGTKDFWAFIAHYFIPDSGPSGRYGFNKSDCRVINVPAMDYRHSDFFKPPNHLRQGFDLWSKFLSQATHRLDKLAGQTVNNTDWQQSSILLRALGRYVLLSVALVVSLFLGCAFVVGIVVCARQILKWL